MLEVGVAANKYGPGLTPTQERTHFVLWALMKAPLLIGADLRNISQHALDLLSNKDIIAVNQVGSQCGWQHPRQYPCQYP